MIRAHCGLEEDPAQRGRCRRDAEERRGGVLAFVTAYNFAKHLKALRWRTPYQVICEAWTKAPSTFKINLRHLITGPPT